jgi:UDP-N-acetylglucosamine/UDP-N-acetylgalactosamine 4-epimerase
MSEIAARYEAVQAELQAAPRRWLVTGAAGFIGSALLEKLLELGQGVVALDNLSTGFRHNLDDVRDRVGDEAWSRCRFLEGDLLDLDACQEVCRDVDFVLHQAALGSVPRSLADPIATNASNITGFLNILVAARNASVRRFVYAASSSTYGDSAELPKVEERIGNPLSPYAVTKYVNELYAKVFGRAYDMQTVGLRYFNVFGRRQDPGGAYAAVIPKWVSNLLHGQRCLVNGDGETSRDFTYIENVVQANPLAATAEAEGVAGEVFNVACGDRTTLNELYRWIHDGLRQLRPDLPAVAPKYGPFRPWDVRHSVASIEKGRAALGYAPSHGVKDGLAAALDWYAASLSAPQGASGH